MLIYKKGLVNRSRRCQKAGSSLKRGDGGFLWHKGWSASAGQPPSDTIFMPAPLHGTWEWAALQPLPAWPKVAPWVQAVCAPMLVGYNGELLTPCSWSAAGSAARHVPCKVIQALHRHLLK